MSLINRWRKNEEVLPERIISVLNQGESKQINKAPAYLIPGLGLSDQDEGVGGDDGEAEVDEDDGALRADVPAAREEGRETHPVTACPGSPLKSSNPGQALQNWQFPADVLCAGQTRTRGGRQGEKMSPSSPIKAGVRSQQAKGQPSLSPS